MPASTAVEEATQEYDRKAYNVGCTQSVCIFYCIGLDPDDTDSEEETEDKGKPGDFLRDLDNRYELEREALMARLRGA